MKQLQRHSSSINPRKIQSAFSRKIQINQHNFYSPRQTNRSILDKTNYIQYRIFNEQKSQLSPSPRKLSHFSFKTSVKTPTQKHLDKSQRPLSVNVNLAKKKKIKNLKYNFQEPRKKWRFSDEPIWKKFLRGKLLYLVKKNIILCEKKFNPKLFTENITNVHLKEFKTKFRNLDDRNKVGIFTNRYPSILNQGNRFYTRYFDYFISPDELLNQNFTKKEIFQIKADPVYFNLGGDFSNVYFFRKRTLKETLNEEEKKGSKFLDTMEKSLKLTKKRIQSYLNYYTSVMSKQGIIG